MGIDFKTYEFNIPLELTMNFVADDDHPNDCSIYN